MKIYSLTFYALLFLVFACSSNDTSELEAELKMLQEKMSEMKTATPEPTGMIHSVFFWLNEDLSAQERKDFLIDLRNLAEVTAVNDVFIGPPFATENRFGVEDSYDYALIVHFKDLAAHDAY